MSNSVTSQTAPSNDAALEWMRQYDLQRRKCSEENGVLRNIVKRALADGMNVKAMSATSRARKLDTQLVVADMRDTIRYMNLRSIPMEPDDLFNGWDTRITDKTREIDTLFEAENAGYAAGRAGAKIEDCPYQAGTDLHVEWVRSWKLGQAAIARELGPDVKQASTARQRPAGRQPRIPGTEPAQPSRERVKKAAPRGRAKKAGRTGRRAARLNGGRSVAEVPAVIS